MRTNNIAAVAAQYRKQKERDGGKRRGADAFKPVQRNWRAGGKDKDVHTMPAGQPLTLEQLRGMDGKCVKIVVDGQEPLEMLALVEAPEDEDCVLLRNNLGGVSEFYSDEDLREDGVKAYAYPPAHIDREAWEPCGLCGTLNDEIMCRFSKKTEYDQSTTSRYAMARFCPNCCRPLTEEAWAELENRVRGITG